MKLDLKKPTIKWKPWSVEWKRKEDVYHFYLAGR